MRLIDADALIAETMKNRCADCDRRKGVKKGKITFVYGFGAAPCRACDAGDMIETLNEAPTVSGWIPFVKRPLTDDEKNTHPNWCYILEGNVPEDEEEILLYRPWKNSEGYIITMDQYMNNGTECYLDGAGDIENGMFWMPRPEPPKEG